MKKFSRLLCSLLVLVMLICSFGAVCVSAQDSGELREAKITFFVWDEAKDIKYKEVDVQLINVDTQEEIIISGIAGRDKTLKLPLGEYMIEKITLTEAPEIEIETSNHTLIVDTSDYYTFLTIPLKRVITTEENQEEVENTINEFKAEEAADLSLAGSLVLWLLMGIISLVYLIRSKYTKKEMKAPFLKAKGKFIGHICIGLLGGLVGYLVFGDTDYSWIGMLVGFGFPFGLFSISIFYHPSTNDDRYYDSDRDRGTKYAIVFVIVFMLSFVIGAIVAPVVIIRDIIEIIKTYIDYVKWRIERRKNSAK